MIKPENLKKGDRVIIVSPAGFIDQTFIDYAEKLYESWGLIAQKGESILNKHRIFAGTDEERLNDFQIALDDENIRAIFCSRGGYGTNRIIEKLNFSKFLKNPKWIVGFSDITMLLSTVNELGIMGIHGAMPKNYTTASDSAIESLRKILFGEQFTYSVHPHNLNQNGKANAQLVGGNLSIIYSLLGTKYMYDFTGKILFIEDLNEKLYHLDRMLRSLRIQGVFNSISGLIVGQMTDMLDGKPSFGRDAYETISDIVKEYEIPVCYNFPVGHFENNQALLVGGNYTLEVREKEVSLSQL